MHNDHALVEARLDRFVRDHVHPAVYRDPRSVTVSAWQVPREPVPFAEAVQNPFEPVAVGWRWGRAWSTVWLHVLADLDPDWVAAARRAGGAELLVDFGYNRSRSGFQAEGLGYRPDGTVLKSIAPLNSWLPVDLDSDRFEVYIEAAANPDVAGDYTFEPTPYGQWDTAPDEPLYSLAQLELAIRDLEVWELAQDIWTLRGLMRELPEGSSRRHNILRAFEDCLDLVDPDDVSGSAAAARRRLDAVLSQPAAASAHSILATGHAHIDSAWLWPLRETVRKCARTFTNAMSLMDDYPEFVFSCSSAQQYAWMKEHHPQVFARIAEKVAAGQWVPVGGMWVESDTNMPGGEAMARQFIAGKTFFLSEFGVDCREAWLPDSFGYSAALPQIVAEAGEQFFLTQKISWNQINRMPHHTFTWEGIDGTRIFTHFPPVDTYISELSGAELAHAERNFSEKGRASMSLVPFGWGDGGGGPTREMVAAAARTADLDGSPRVTIGSPAEFFEAAHAEYPGAPVWRGEMYLELHRGVFTSQLRTKQGNRRNEALLREAELWATTAAVRAGAEYPREALRDAWHTVLLLQFHDILPGSSIAWVHREAEERHATVTDTLNATIERSIRALVGPSDAPDARPLRANAVASARGEVAALAIGHDPADQSATVTVDEGEDGVVLDSASLRVVIGRDGRLRSLRGRDGREAIAPGHGAAALRLHRDLPNLWDAWDLDEHYRRTVTELAAEHDGRVERGDDGSATVVSRATIGASRATPTVIEQRVTLRPGSSELDLEYRIDWHETEKILKLAFPLDVHADDVAAETQFGHVRRPTHTNTSWDAARFEACQHRFLHVAEPDWGVAIANDSTYGYDVDRTTRADGGTTTTVRFSLLRAPRFPDPDSDQGMHVLRFRIRPAASIGDAVRMGQALATPLRSVVGTHAVEPLVSSSHDAVLIDTVKLAEDGSGDVIVRLYESQGKRASTELTAAFSHRALVLTDLLERPRSDAEPSADGVSVSLTFRPFQLRTVRFVR